MHYIRRVRTWNEVARVPTLVVTPPRREETIVTPPWDNSVATPEVEAIVTLQVLVVSTMDVITDAAIEDKKVTTPRTATTKQETPEGSTEIPQ
jgi:hypothetical protein